MSLLGIDIGTTGCKAAAFSEEGACLAQAYREYPTRHPQEGWAQLDSTEVWRHVCDVVRETAAGTEGDPITALCTSSLGETVVPVSSDRRVLGPGILCSDVRGADHAERLAAELGQEEFYRINPNLLGPHYTLPKLLWLRDNDPGAFDGADRFLLWGDMPGFMLGCDPVTSNSLANRTLLFDLQANDWSDTLLGWAGIDRDRLGVVCPGGTVVGTADPEAAAGLGLPAGVCVVAGGHDQCCNALGSGCVSAGEAVCGIGSFECIAPVYGPVQDPLGMLNLKLNIEHHVLPELFVSFIYNQAGTLVKWFRDTFAAADRPAEPGGDVYAALNEEMPDGPTDLLVLPHFDPPLWPEYIPDSSGAIVGLRTTTTRGEILKAIMESATLYFADSISALRELGIDTRSFVATGGGARSDRWLQVKADIFGIPFVRPHISEGSLAGAAMLAGLATGRYAHPAEAVAHFVREDRLFEPDAGRHVQYSEKLAIYRDMFPATRELSRRLRGG